MKPIKIKIKITAIFVIANIALITLSGCGDSSKSSTSGVSSEISVTPVVTSENTDTSTIFSDRDKEIGYDESTAVKLALNGDTVQCDDAGVSIDGSVVTIKAEGTYILSGELSFGQIVIDAAKTDKLQLVLNDVNINCDSSAAIYVKQADKLFITLATDTQNTLSNKSEFVAIDENSIDSVIFSKEDLTLNGLGSLTINAAFGHGIVSKDSLIITSGSYTINAAGHGMTGKDSIAIADGSFTISAKKDGIHAENNDDAALGSLYISGGAYAITAVTDGLSAASTLQVDGGTFNLATGGGSVNASTDTAGNVRESWGKWDRATEQPIGTAEPTAAAEAVATVSAKGLKASGDLAINAGDFTIDSSDDAIHSNSSITINGGEITISSGDDGLHADTSTTINNGTLNINKSYEGIEGQSVTIAGGIITLTASDDGINAAGGNDGSAVNGRPGMGSFNTSADCFIKISGGKLNVNASGDGVDSNGALYVSGGEAYVSGSENSGNGALDYAGEAQITGGIFVAVGQSGMAQNFSDTSTQGSILASVANVQEGTVSVNDSTGKELISYTPQKSYNSVVVSCPDILKGQTYTISMGTDSQSITMSELIYGSSAGMGGMTL